MYLCELWGNELVKKNFASAVERGGLAHTYIIEGGRGSGKMTLARAVMQQLCCTSLTPPCGDCEACRKIAEDKTPDVVTIRRRGDKKTLGVDEIREALSDISMLPIDFEYRAYIIPECEQMTVAAQNSLLKILEEPPSYVFFFLLTDSAAALLPTVRSRAQLIRTEIFTDNQLEEYLLANNKKATALQKRDSDAFARVIRLSGGRIGVANELLASSGKHNSDVFTLVRDTLTALAQNNRASLTLVQVTVSSSRETYNEYLGVLLTALRDVAAEREAPGIECTFFRDGEEAEQYGQMFTSRARLGFCRAAEKAILRNTQIYVNVRLDAACLMCTLYSIRNGK